MYRIGNGFDVHRFEPEAMEGANIVLAGVEIPHTHLLLAHSDGDVLCHALCDALLGALALGDIGQHFPNTDMQYRGISSIILLERVNALIQNRGFVTYNIDAVIIAQKPKLATFIPAMRDNIASALGIAVEKISIKATTAERLGSIGEGKGIAAEAIVSVIPRAQDSKLKTRD